MGQCRYGVSKRECSYEGDDRETATVQTRLETVSGVREPTSCEHRTARRRPPSDRCAPELQPLVRVMTVTKPMEDSNPTDRDVVQALEYAENRLAEAEDVIWNVESEKLSAAQQQSLNELSEEVWSIQSRLIEIKDDCTD